MKYASLGSISTGTLRSDDLLVAFSDELEYHVQRNPEFPRDGAQVTIRAAAELLDTNDDSRDDDWHESAAAIIEELSESLSAFAAPYCTFSAHYGDGADFGFWPDHDAIEELPRVNDSDEARELGEDCCLVNDHGNVTVYGGDGSVILAIV